MKLAHIRFAAGRNAEFGHFRREPISWLAPLWLARLWVESACSSVFSGLTACRYLGSPGQPILKDRRSCEQSPATSWQYGLMSWLRIRVALS